MQRKHIIFTILLLIFASGLKAQRMYTIYLDSDVEMNEIKSGTEMDSVSIIRTAHRVTSELHDKGYITATVDAISFKDKVCSIKYFKGNVYKISAIHIQEKDQPILTAAGLASFKLNNTIPDSLRQNKYMTGLLNFLVNHGYPFASVSLVNVAIEQGNISANLNIVPGKQINFGQIKTEGKIIVGEQFLARYLEIKKGQPYDHNKVLNVRQKLRNLPFVEEYESPKISFVNNEAILYLLLKSRKSSTFDFIIGLAPSLENGIRKWNINGEFNGDLYNKLGAGERIQIKLKRLTAEDQALYLAGSYPYLFKSPVGLDASLSILRNRNQSIDLSANLGAQYILSGNKTAKVYWSLRSSRLSTVDTTRIKSTKKLPNQLDYNYKGGGVSFHYNKLDYRFNPRSGWLMEFAADLGERSIVKNNIILGISSPSVDFGSAYDTLKINTLQLNTSIAVHKHFAVSTWASVKTSLQGGFKYNDGRVLDNELYRIGGNRLLRGFDELSILTDLYGVLTTEFRIILDQNSFLTFPFIDIARQRVYIEDIATWDTAIGLGMGINFATKAGIFNLAFSAGKRLENPFDFGKTKLHFGYVSLF